MFPGIDIRRQFLPLYDPEVMDACNYTSNVVNISLSLSSYALVIFRDVRCIYHHFCAKNFNRKSLRCYICHATLHMQMQKGVEEYHKPVN